MELKENYQKRGNLLDFFILNFQLLHFNSFQVYSKEITIALNNQGCITLKGGKDYQQQRATQVRRVQALDKVSKHIIFIGRGEPIHAFKDRS